MIKTYNVVVDLKCVAFNDDVDVKDCFVSYSTIADFWWGCVLNLSMNLKNAGFIEDECDSDEYDPCVPTILKCHMIKDPTVVLEINCRFSDNIKSKLSRQENIDYLCRLRDDALYHSDKEGFWEENSIVVNDGDYVFTSYPQLENFILREMKWISENYK